MGIVIKGLPKGFKGSKTIIASELNKFFVRALAVYKKGIRENPWRIGSVGGGSPVNTGRLRDSHRTQIKNYNAKIYTTLPYAVYVYHGTKKMQSRPWLQSVANSKDREINRLIDKMTKTIISKSLI